MTSTLGTVAVVLCMGRIRGPDCYLARMGASAGRQNHIVVTRRLRNERRNFRSRARRIVDVGVGQREMACAWRSRDHGFPHHAVMADVSPWHSQCAREVAKELAQLVPQPY